MPDNPSSASKTNSRACYSTKPATNQNAGYGFKFVGPPSRRRKVADPEERTIMARIVADKEAGKSFYDIAAALLWEGVRTRAGVEWSRDRVKRAYLAELALRAAEPAKTKRCCTCREFKPLTTEHFHRNASDPAGFHRMCKPCRCQYGREKWREAKRRPFLLLGEAVVRGVDTPEGAAAYQEAVAGFSSAKDFVQHLKASLDASQDPEYSLALFDTVFRIAGRASGRQCTE